MKTIQKPFLRKRFSDQPFNRRLIVGHLGKSVFTGELSEGEPWLTLQTEE